jgi:hypothetical protein
LRIFKEVAPARRWFFCGNKESKWDISHNFCVVDVGKEMGVGTLDQTNYLCADSVSKEREREMWGREWSGG